MNSYEASRAMRTNMMAGFVRVNGETGWLLGQDQFIAMRDAQAIVATGMLDQNFAAAAKQLF
jgi:hypothetical protein